MVDDPSDIKSRVWSRPTDERGWLGAWLRTSVGRTPRPRLSLFRPRILHFPSLSFILTILLLQFKVMSRLFRNRSERFSRPHLWRVVSTGHHRYYRLGNIRSERISGSNPTSLVLTPVPVTDANFVSDYLDCWPPSETSNPRSGRNFPLDPSSRGIDGVPVCLWVV